MNHELIRCENCRNHGRCKKERTAFKPWHIKGCIVEAPPKGGHGECEQKVK